MSSLYDAVGGDAGVLRLAAAWHERVLADDVVAHAFSHGFRHDHTERLAAYIGEALGGPPAYSALLGTEAGVVRMHSGNGVHEEMDRRAIACFDGAIGDAGIIDPTVADALHDYFAAATARLAAHPDDDDVPDDLTVPLAVPLPVTESMRKFSTPESGASGIL